jgi:hypothetical protein
MCTRMLCAVHSGSGTVRSVSFLGKANTWCLPSFLS